VGFSTKLGEIEAVGDRGKVFLLHLSLVYAVTESVPAAANLGKVQRICAVVNHSGDDHGTVGGISGTQGEREAVPGLGLRDLVAFRVSFGLSSICHHGSLLPVFFGGMAFIKSFAREASFLRDAPYLASWLALKSKEDDKVRYLRVVSSR
jgi:hypothetical protein